MLFTITFCVRFIQLFIQYINIDSTQGSAYSRAQWLVHLTYPVLAPS